MASQRLQRPIYLVLDFDGTLTVQDTMNVLGRLPKAPEMSWPAIAQAYMNDYHAHQAEPFPWQRYDRAEYSRWLASRKWVETRSAQRVQDAKFFQLVTFDELRLTVAKALRNGDLKLRKRWTDLLQLGFSGPAGSHVRIVSVNWSETFVRSVLVQAAANLGMRDLAKRIEAMEIHANEIDGLHAPGGSSGRVCRSDAEEDIRTSADKLRHLPRSEGDELTVYVGDSATDFDCLCAADVGVWLYDAPIEDYARIFKEIFRPLDFVPPSIKTIHDTGRPKPLFYWARNLEQVIEALETSPT